MKSKQKPIQVALFGMDQRTQKTMEMYLHGPCKGIADVCSEFEADIDIIDADSVKARDLLEERQFKTPDRPIILLSLQPLSINDTFYASKPVKSEELINVIKQAELSRHETKQTENEFTTSIDELESKTAEPEISIKKESDEQIVNKEKEQKKILKHRTAGDLTEDKFSAYLGHVEGLDFSDPEQVLLASFDSKNYFLNYVQSAIRVAINKNRILQLNSSWKPLIIFPHSYEVWLDINDKQLRVFSGLVISNRSSMTLTAVDHNKNDCNRKTECFYDADMLIWKLAVWTSKGRYPKSLDIKTPVYLKNWPNFTRLLITPHALQISALLVLEPRTMMDIVDTLKIKPQYVFVFIAAAHALGLVGQVKRQSDVIVSPVEIKEPKTKSLLGKLLGKLRK